MKVRISSELLRHYDGISEVHVDLTHGINYLPILTYRCIKEVLELFSIFKGIRLRTYNADPFRPGVVNRLSVNVIEDGMQVPRPFSGKIRQERVLEPVDLSSEERRKLLRKI